MIVESWLRLLRAVSSKGRRHDRFPVRRMHVELLEGRDCPSGGHLFVADFGGDNVLRYDGASGAFVDTFVPKHSGGMNQPYGVLFGPDGNGDGRKDLYVSTGENGGPGQLKAVLRYDGVTGALIDEFTKGGDLQSPTGIIFGPDGSLYVATGTGGSGGRVAHYDGRTGAFLGDFVAPGSGGLRAPSGMVFGPSGNNSKKLDLYVSSRATHNILRYDGSTGAFLGDFVVSGSAGLDTPQGLTFGPDGNLYVASSAILNNNARGVLRFQGPTGPTPGAFLDTFVPADTGALRTPFGPIFGPDGNGDGQFDLYVTSSRFNGVTGNKATVKRYDGVTGAFIDTFVTEGSGGLDEAQFLTFTETDPVTLAYTGMATGAASVPRSAEPVTADIANLTSANVTKPQGDHGQQSVTLSFRTVNGAATTSDNDYVAKSGTLTFAPGETTKTITIEVRGDSKREGSETFYLDLFNLSSNALFTKNRGLSTILNDD
jgi:hypothetical protein